MNSKGKVWYIGLVLALGVGVVALAGCGGGSATPTSSASAYTSKTLNTSYQGALSASDQLMLGTTRLEGTDQAVTPEQAKALLPLWQIIQDGTLKADAERNAVYAQIEAQMTPAQLSAIAALQLTQQSLTESQQGRGAPPGGSTDGGQAQFGNMSDEQRQAMRATAQAGGGQGGFGGGQRQLGNMSDEQQAAMRATFEAGGGRPGNARGTPGASGAAPRQGSFMLGLLIRLLTQRASGDTAPSGPPPAPSMTPTP